jgi:hypothetical protein
LPRLTAISFRPYRGHQIEMRDPGKGPCQVVIHPPGGRGSPHAITPLRPEATLAEQVQQAKEMIDAVMGPKPPPRFPRPGAPRHEPLR